MLSTPFIWWFIGRRVHAGVFEDENRLNKVIKKVNSIIGTEQDIIKQVGDV